MSELLRRTDEWERLKKSGMVAIKDEPGVINIYRPAPLEKVARQFTWMWIGFSLLGFVGFAGLGIWGILFGGLMTTLLSSLSFGLLARGARRTAQKFADQVVFTPNHIYFLNKGRDMGSLPRAGMQQIVADRHGQGMCFHRFLSDGDFFCAFAGSNPTSHLITNNILMTAFNQPLHLDGMEQVVPMDRVVVEQYHTAPQVVGLRAVQE